MRLHFFLCWLSPYEYFEPVRSTANAVTFAHLDSNFHRLGNWRNHSRTVGSRNAFLFILAAWRYWRISRTMDCLQDIGHDPFPHHLRNSTEHVGFAAHWMAIPPVCLRILSSLHRGEARVRNRRAIMRRLSVFKCRSRARVVGFVQRIIYYFTRAIMRE